MGDVRQRSPPIASALVYTTELASFRNTVDPCPSTCQPHPSKSNPSSLFIDVISFPNLCDKPQGRIRSYPTWDHTKQRTSAKSMQKKFSQTREQAKAHSNSLAPIP